MPPIDRIPVRQRHRRPADKAQVRRDILAVTVALLKEKGYENFSLREVARRVGFSVGNLYLYFRNRDDLLYAVIEDGFRRFRADLAAAAAQKDPLKRIAAMGRRYVDFGRAHAALYDVMFVKCPDYLFVERPIPGLDTLAMLQEAIRDGVHAGLIRKVNVESLADAIWATVHGIVVLARAGPLFDHDRTDRALTAALEVILNGIRLD